ncbi:MAG: ATP-binding cassette domain-containing protein, partial [Acidimicrobiales bacterium]
MTTGGRAGKPLRIDRLGKTYATRAGGEVEALGPITLEVEASEFVVIVGPTGCGKSTLLQILAGFLEPTAGQVLVDGTSITGPSLDRSMVFQSYALFPWLSVVENVEFGLRGRARSRQECRELAMHQLRLVGLQS